MRALAALLIMVATLTLGACTRPGGQKDFASAEEAVAALIAAAKTGDIDDLVEVLGPDTKPLVESGDPVMDNAARERFLQGYDKAHALETSTEGFTTLVVGEDKWPFPFPLVETDGRWRFDSTEGVEQLVDRRVGENELFTIQACLAFVDAEREYYTRNPQNDPLLHFAQKLISSEGQKDGLYWPTAEGEEPSPLGEGFARARAEGYFTDEDARGAPFHGYIYHLLTGQGPNANGGAYSYLVGDKMLGGFGLIAFPAEYGASGVMTFVVNHEGVVYSKDLGPETANIAVDIEVFDPDSTWKREASSDDPVQAVATGDAQN